MKNAKICKYNAIIQPEKNHRERLITYFFHGEIKKNRFGDFQPYTDHFKVKERLQKDKSERKMRKICT